MSRSLEACLAQALEEVLAGVRQKAINGATADPQKLLLGMESTAFDAAVASTVLYLQLRASRLSGE